MARRVHRAAEPCSGAANRRREPAPPGKRGAAVQRSRELAPRTGAAWETRRCGLSGPLPAH
jgi:hypothetical protein